MIPARLIRRLKLTLATKFNLLTISLILVCSVGIILFLIRAEIKNSYAELFSHGHTLADMVSKNSEYGIYTENREFLLNIVESLTVDPDIAYVSIFNQNKGPLVSKIFKPTIKIPTSLLNKETGLIKQFLHEEFLNQGDGNRYVDFLLPVMSYGSGDPSGIFLNKEEVPKQQTIGYIQIGLTQESLRKRIHQFLLTSLMVTSFIVLLGVLLTLLITRKITSPIKKLKLATQDISEGKFDHHIAIETKDEISDLTQSFNHMLEYLRTYQAQIEDRNARMTAANIQMQQEITERRSAEEALRKSEEAAQRLAEENAIVAEIGRIISSSLNIDEVYERFTKEVAKLIAFDRIAINTVDIEKGTTATPYAAGIDVPNRQIGISIPLAGTATEECFRTKSSMLIQPDDIDECIARFPGLSPTFQASLRSIILAPLISKDQFIGALSLGSLKPKAYTDQDVRLTESIANQIAGAIANAQLFSERVRAEQKAKSLEEQLRQSQRIEAVGQLAGGIAHDFNNLLTVIKGYSELLLIKLKEGDPIKGNIEEIHRASLRAADLTRQLLAFSRRQILEFKVLDLNSILPDLDKMLHRLIGEDIELVFLLSGHLGKIKSDAGQIEQVILNLAVNARDAMPSGGKLTIETANVELDETYARTHIGVKPGRYVMLSVSDTGVGMTPEVKEHIFEPFFTTKEKGKGTGLGLSTVYGIVKQSEGEIWVYSEPGHGTTFKIYLPRVEEEATALPHGDDKGPLPRGSETILLVEDEPSVRGLAVQILRENGYRLLEAANGNEALRMAQEYAGEIHLLLTDVVMPQMGGKELANRLKTLRPGMKVLFTSGYTDDAIVHHGVLNSGIDFLQKPFSPETLAQKVREILDK